MKARIREITESHQKSNVRLANELDGYIEDMERRIDRAKAARNVLAPPASTSKKRKR